jgi:hypothetical protein
MYEIYIIAAPALRNFFLVSVSWESIVFVCRRE